MFLDFYKLREHPFGVTPDPRYLYLSQTHREALASLVYGIESGRGFMALIGRSGMGKTTLLFQLLERWRMSFRTLYLFQTQCDSRELLRYLLYDLGVENPEQDFVKMHLQLNQLLMREAQAGRRVVLFIDEAQNLQDSVLETVRLLSNFETPSAKLLQIVLAGQPELAEKLARPGLAQLRQRIAIFSRLDPFGRAEIDHYVEHRLLIAGYKGGPLFTHGALSLIAERSKGIPRNINNLCFSALSLGYAMSRSTIDSSIVQEVVADLDLASLPRQDATTRADVVVSPTKHQTSAKPKRGLGRAAFPAAVLAGLLILLGLFAIFFFERKPPHASPPQSSQSSLGEGKVGLGRTLTVVVKPDETLEKISLRYLGQYGSKLTKEICDLNPELKDPNHIEVGQRIRLPWKPGTSGSDLLAASQNNQVTP